MIRPKYGAISAVQDIVEPWIELWGGDEWGESMYGLHAAATTSYGLSDEDCALVAEILLRNVIEAKEWAEEYKGSEEEEEKARDRCRHLRNYWLAGGNLGDWATTKEDAKHSIDQMPEWFFEKGEDNA